MNLCIKIFRMSFQDDTTYILKLVNLSKSLDFMHSSQAWLHFFCIFILLTNGLLGLIWVNYISYLMLVVHLLYVLALLLCGQCDVFCVICMQIYTHEHWASIATTFFNLAQLTLFFILLDHLLITLNQLLFTK